MKTNEFVSILLGANESNASNNTRNRIGFICYDEPVKEIKPVNEKNITNVLLSGLAIMAFIEAFKEWFEFELTNYTCGGFGCVNDYQLKSKIEAIKYLP